ncbi:hypothetical protein [Usitatibacter palustris]|nr:hypothetical protein [Usitatibacter palustris]
MKTRIPRHTPPLEAAFIPVYLLEGLAQAYGPATLPRPFTPVEQMLLGVWGTLKGNGIAL